MRAILASLAFALPAYAETTYTWGMFEGYRSTITLQDTQAPGAVAEVIFDNLTVHSDELVTFTLILDGLVVEITALVGRGETPDHMTVIPPEGYIADPPEIDVPENDVGRVLIREWVGF